MPNDMDIVNCFSIALPADAEPNTLNHLFAHVASSLSTSPIIDIDDVAAVTFEVEHLNDRDAGIFTIFFTSRGGPGYTG